MECWTLLSFRACRPTGAKTACSSWAASTPWASSSSSQLPPRIPSRPRKVRSWTIDKGFKVSSLQVSHVLCSSRFAEPGESSEPREQRDDGLGGFESGCLRIKPSGSRQLWQSKSVRLLRYRCKSNPDYPLTGSSWGLKRFSSRYQRDEHAELGRLGRHRQQWERRRIDFSSGLRWGLTLSFPCWMCSQLAACFFFAFVFGTHFLHVEWKILIKIWNYYNNKKKEKKNLWHFCFCLFWYPPPGLARHPTLFYPISFWSRWRHRASHSGSGTLGSRRR